MKSRAFWRTAAFLAAWMALFGTAFGQGVSEKDDFYEAVNAQTLAEKKIEPTAPSWSWFYQRSEENTKELGKDLTAIVEKRGTYEKGTPEQKIADLYQCALDMETRDKTSRPQLEALVAPIKAAKSTTELTAALRQIDRDYGMGLVLDYTADKMPRSLRYIPTLKIMAPGLSREELEKEIQPGAWQLYKDSMKDILVEAGYSEAEAKEQAEKNFAFEQKSAPYLLTSEQKNDVTVLTRMSSRKAIEKLTPHLDGAGWLRYWGLDKEKQFFVSNPDYLRYLDSVYTDENLPILKSDIIGGIYRAYAPYSDRRLRDIARSYVMKKYGIAQARSDEETARRLVQGLLSYDFGQVYQKQHFTAEMDADIRQMVDDIRQVYRRRLKKNDWMSQETKAKAIEKIDSLRVFVGGPAADDKPLLEPIREVQSEEEGGNLLANILHNGKLLSQQVRALIGTDFNPDKWYAFDPQDVNAAYIPENNSITIPAGILKPPFYDRKAAYGDNLGGIGVVIGHEISHAFDPNGSKYDKDGNMNNWWKKADYEAFQQRSAAFGPYYDTFYVVPEVYEDGKLVTNEAIADCGGLSVVTEIAGNDRTMLRQIYHTFATVFAQKTTRPMLMRLIQSDPHPNGRARVNGALSTTEGFYEAYDIEAGDGMYKAPEKRVKLW